MNEACPGRSPTCNLNSSDEPVASTSSSPDGEKCEDGGDIGRYAIRLRKRKVSLSAGGAYDSMVVSNVCQVRNCGLQLRDSDALEAHYRVHVSQELANLRRLRVHKSSSDGRLDQQQLLRHDVRQSVADKIRQKRQRRQAAPVLARASSDAPTSGHRCPVCEKTVEEDKLLIPHLDECMRNSVPEHLAEQPRQQRLLYCDLPSDVETDSDAEGQEEEEVPHGFEVYSWAGHTRIRATSLIEGGLSGSGFTTITPSDEAMELDIETVESEDMGQAQFTDADLIDAAVTPEDHSTGSSPEERDAVASHQPDPKQQQQQQQQKVAEEEKEEEENVAQLQKANRLLRQQVMCKICMDPYNEPLVCINCWHVHCRLCWLRALGAKKLCPQCKVIIQPKDLRRIYL